MLARRAGPGTVSIVSSQPTPRSGLNTSPDIEAALTDRQRLALEKTHVGGSFDWPGQFSGTDPAASMDISPTPYHHHPRATEGKVLAALFDG